MDPYEKLANAIIILAARDYRTALRRQKKKATPGNEQEIRNIERFFRSQYFDMLTGVDGEYLIEQIRKEEE